MKTREDLAKIIVQMSYAELRKLGRELCDMSDPQEKVWDLRNDQEWSDMLHAWAENNIETE
jgi:hypothetical protein